MTCFERSETSMHVLNASAGHGGRGEAGAMMTMEGAHNANPSTLSGTTKVRIQDPAPIL